MPKLPPTKRLREIADRLWSVAVRSRWMYCCAVCGRQPSEAHHLVPRQHEATRYDVRNGVALCSYHHKFCRDVSPHQNAAGFMKWLRYSYPDTLIWYRDNCRPKFEGVKNTTHYVGQILNLRQHVAEDEFKRIVGVKLAARLEDEL